MALKIHFAVVDHSAEATGSRMYVQDLDNSNYDDIFGVIGNIALLQDAYQLLTDCGYSRTTASIETYVGAAVPPEAVTAQREIAIRVTYRDTVNGRVERFDLPGPKLALYPPAGTDTIALDNVLASPFIAVFEANAVSRDGNPVEVTGLRLVGRNS